MFILTDLRTVILEHFWILHAVFIKAHYESIFLCRIKLFFFFKLQKSSTHLSIHYDVVSRISVKNCINFSESCPFICTKSREIKVWCVCFIRRESQELWNLLIRGNTSYNITERFSSRFCQVSFSCVHMRTIQMLWKVLVCGTFKCMSDIL